MPRAHRGQKPLRGIGLRSDEVIVAIGSRKEARRSNGARWGSSRGAWWRCCAGQSRSRLDRRIGGLGKNGLCQKNAASSQYAQVLIKGCFHWWRKCWLKKMYVGMAF